MNTGKQGGNELDDAWKRILLIWKAGFVCLAVCFTATFILHLMNVQLEVNSSFPLEYLTYGLLGVAAFDILVLFPIRKIALKIDDKITGEAAARQAAARRYTSVTLITIAILGSIGVYGLVVFAISRDVISLMIFLVLAASGMLFFRPNREALMDLAGRVKKT